MHILLFLLLFLAAIVIFGLSIVGFVLRAISGLAVVRLPGRSRQGVDKPASSKVVPAITRTRTAVPITKGKSLYNPQIEMFARFKMKSSFHKTKRII